MIFQLVIVRQVNHDLECQESTPCWVPVFKPISNPCSAYEKYQSDYNYFIENYNGDLDDIGKSFELLCQDWLDNDQVTYSVNEIVFFARQLDADSFEITPTYFNGVTEEIVNSHIGSVNVFVKTEGDKSDA